MIALRKVRIVNWHYFRDETIAVGERTLISGNNAMGKSTIVDAIQYALAADLRKARFNLAAGDRRGGRDLIGYVRCKIGSESTEYLRGDTVAHIMLSFTDGKSDFTAAVCVEAFSDGRISERFWIGKSIDISSVPVLTDAKRPLSWRQFRDLLDSRQVSSYESKREYLRNLTDLLGVFRRMSEYNPYLESFTRSVSFTPLVSVDRFVCDYILEERTLDISIMKTNLESYKEAERQANATVRKIDCLTEISSLEKEYRRLQTNLAKQDYLKLYIDTIIARDKLKQTEKDKQNVCIQIEQIMSQIEENTQRRNIQDTSLREVQAALARDDAHTLYLSLKEKIESLQKEKEQAKEDSHRFNTIIDQCKSLLEGTGISGKKKATDNSHTSNREILEHYSDDLEAARAESEEKRYTTERTLDETEQALRECVKELNDLERGIRKYPESSASLANALKENGIDAWILSDLAEITDPQWANAIEGWLNTLRFAVVVEPSFFQQALEVYDSLPKTVGGVALPNIARLKTKADEARKGSLASLVSSDNPWARIYLTAILGEVMTADLDSLKNHSKAITKDCMSYSNHTATRIKEEVWRNHWLGKRAREQRLTQLKTERSSLESKKKDLIILRDNLIEILRVYSQAIRSLADVRPLSEADSRIITLEKRIEEAKNDLSQIDISSSLALEEKRIALTRVITELSAERDKLTTDQERARSRNEYLVKEKEQQEIKVQESLHDFESFCADKIAELSWLEEYANDRLKRSSPEDIELDYAPARKRLETRSNTTLAQYRKKVSEYTNQFSCYASVEIEDYSALAETLDHLERSELPNYRDRIIGAREDAEKEFREHFIAKLNEYIIEAKESFREINETLKDLAFGNDHYSFSLEERSDRRGQIRIVQKAAEVTSYEGGLFEQIIDPQERKATEELFEKIIRSDLNSAEMRSICDYRTYFTYDIRIRDAKAIDPATGKPVELSLSRVLREKSGGESQTPYYVAIAASFYRFFKDKSDSTIRFVLFDEAFDKLDDERISRIIEFYSSMGIQLMMAVPPGKIEAIAPLMDHVSIVSRIGQQARIREYRSFAGDAE